VYLDWLRSEGAEAGGIGPAEAAVAERRHIADSLLFASPLSDDPEIVWDLGSGIGLPGIPLAILMPTTHFRLFDRSERRTQLIRRATRILGIDNTDVVIEDFTSVSGDFPVVVTRAALPPSRTRDLVLERLSPGGCVIQGGSWTSRPDHEGWETIEIPATVLDQTVWLLIMRHQ